MEKEQDLTWLEQLQKNSWEPEVIISGISLAVLFVIPSQLFDIAVIFVQDYGLEELPASLALTYFSLIVSVFKIFLIMHLFLRFMWAGMLGITYAFPEGVIKKNLFKMSQDLDYPNPVVYLLKLERWCSMAYGYPLSIVIPISFITVYLISLLGISLLFSLDFQVIYLVFMFTLLVFVVFTLGIKNSKIKSFLGTSLSGTIGAVFQSNLGKWTTSLFSIFLLMLSFPFIMSDINGFSYYQNETNLSEEYYDWPDESKYFESHNLLNARFPRVWTASKVVTGNQMNLYLANFHRDNKDIPKLQVLLETDFDTLGWTKPEKVKDLYRVYLNDSLISTKKWSAVTSGLTGQKGWMSSIPLDHLESGVHEIRIEKLIYLAPFLGAGNQPRHRKKWARFEFVKE